MPAVVPFSYSCDSPDLGESSEPRVYDESEDKVISESNCSSIRGSNPFVIARRSTVLASPNGIAISVATSTGVGGEVGPCANNGEWLTEVGEVGAKIIGVSNPSTTDASNKDAPAGNGNCTGSKFNTRCKVLGIASGEVDMYTGTLYTYLPAGGDRRASTAAGGNPGKIKGAGEAVGAATEVTTEVATSSSLSPVKSMGFLAEYP